MAALLSVEGVSKSFAGVKVLDEVDFSLAHGEIHALLGPNGAGKSTLIKIISGAYVPDSGSIAIDGKPVRINNPRDALAQGVSVIYQEFDLATHLTVAENLWLGREPVLDRLGRIDWTALRDRSLPVLSRLGIGKVSPFTPVRDLSVAEQQLVEIAKALSSNARILIMDEPTASLTRKEIDVLFRVVTQLAKEGIGIIYISHHMDEIFEICSRATILRDGRKVATVDVKDTSRDEIVSAMVGKLIEQQRRETRAGGAEALRVEGLCTRSKLENISLNVRRGEIVGIAGLLGAGRTELLRAIFGADPITAGQIFVNGEPIRVRSPQDAIKAGIGLLTDDRKMTGLHLNRSVRENIAMASLDTAFAPRGVLHLARERAEAGAWFKRLNIKAQGLGQRVVYLSGGNQQKVVFAKWLCRQCRILLLDEPTKGIDVGAKAEVFDVIREFVDGGGSVILVSSELDELAVLCDRIILMKHGRLAGEIQSGAITKETILNALVGEGKASVVS